MPLKEGHKNNYSQNASLTNSCIFLCPKQGILKINVPYKKCMNMKGK